jgi:AcrR family transcriptional regulator
MPRTYQLKRRAERQQETRRRIIEAAIELHAAGDDSIASLARRAGVGRVTVYRHFPDEPSLVLACTTSYFEAHPFPDPTSLADVREPGTRLRLGLERLYQYYADNEPILLAGERDVAAHPVLVEGLAPQLAALEAMRKVLSAGWPETKGGSPVIASAIGHALAFATWRSLARDQGLTRPQAVDLMVALVAGGREVVASRLPRLDERPVSPSRSRGQA